MVGVCKADLCVLLFFQRGIVSGFGLWLIDGLFIIQVMAIIVISFAARRGRRRRAGFPLLRLNPRRSPSTPTSSTCSPSFQAPRPPCSIFRLGQAEIDDVGIGELCSVETQPDLTVLKGSVKQRLGRLGGRRRCRLRLVRGWR